MKDSKQKWLTISLINLFVVAALGLLLRFKILFPLEGVNFKFLLHSHSHFAFAGWITLALATLLVYDILPADKHRQPVYQRLLAGILISAVGMLCTFPFQGYAAGSIIFCSLFILVTYIFSWVFIRDVLRSGSSGAVKVLTVSALLALVLSSAGIYTLAYVMASHSGDVLLYRDAIYTYLHLQYNGFFTLSVFALLIRRLDAVDDTKLRQRIFMFAVVLSLAVLPSLALSYLWHYPGTFIRAAAGIGCLLLVLSVGYFFSIAGAFHGQRRLLHPIARFAGTTAMLAFILKSLLQIGTLFPALGKLVFSNRAVIIGFLHLVLLAFVSLFILAYLVQRGVINIHNKRSRTGLIVFITSVIINEALLMLQGCTEMLGTSSGIYRWLLLVAATGLFSGAGILAAGQWHSRLKWPNIGTAPAKSNSYSQS